MNKPCTYLFPVFTILFAFACLGVPTQAVAQGYCYQCRPWEKDKNYLALPLSWWVG